MSPFPSVAALRPPSLTDNTGVTAVNSGTTTAASNTNNTTGPQPQHTSPSPVLLLQTPEPRVQAVVQCNNTQLSCCTRANIK